MKFEEALMQFKNALANDYLDDNALVEIVVSTKMFVSAVNDLRGKMKFIAFEETAMTSGAMQIYGIQICKDSHEQE